MHKYCVLAVATLGLSAQDIQRHAQIGRGPGGGDGCTISVMVDGNAEVQIRGDNATLHNISGQPPQFRNFECSRPIPPDAHVRYTAESGRGRQELVREPRAGEPLIVRIEDPEPGAGEYRFRLTWGDMGRGEQGAMDRGGDRGDYAQDRARFFQGEGWRRNLFQRVREDVEHVQHSTIPFTGDRARLARTVTELNELQGKLSEGRYDERQLDDVIGALRSVVDENRMPPPDRDALSDDLHRLREFRDRHDDYGARRP